MSDKKAKYVYYNARTNEITLNKVLDQYVITGGTDIFVHKHFVCIGEL